MVFKDNCKLTDKLWIIAERDGEVIYSASPACEMGIIERILALFGRLHCTGDLIPTVALEHMAQTWIDDFGYAAYGTGAVAPAMTNTTLGAEVARKAVDSVELITTDYTNDTARFSVQFTIGGTYAITEFGIFTASSGGTLGSRQTFAPINLIANDKLNMILEIKVS